MWNYVYPDELYHYGVKGMKWGVRRYQTASGALTAAGKKRYSGDSTQRVSRKTKRLLSKASLARESAKEWDEMSGYAKAQGKDKRAKKYKHNAELDRRDANRIDQKAETSRKQDSFRAARHDHNTKRSRGSKIATNLLAGPFANRTYNSVISAGGSHVAAAGVTAVTNLVAGPAGHLLVSHLYTTAAGRDRLVKRY